MKVVIRTDENYHYQLMILVYSLPSSAQAPSTLSQCYFLIKAGCHNSALLHMASLLLQVKHKKLLVSYYYVTGLPSNPLLESHNTKVQN